MLSERCSGKGSIQSRAFQEREPAATMLDDRLAVLPQYLMPKGLLTRLAGRVAQGRRGASTTRLIRWFVGRYGVDMSEAAEPDVAA